MQWVGENLATLLVAAAAVLGALWAGWGRYWARRRTAATVDAIVRAESSKRNGLVDAHRAAAESRLADAHADAIDSVNANDSGGLAGYINSRNDNPN